MRSGLAVILAVLLAATALGGAVFRLGLTTPSPTRPQTAHASLAPLQASYLGVFSPGAPPSYGGIASFAQASGRQPNLLGYFSGWAEPFDTSFAETLHKHHVIPLVQINPTDATIADIPKGTYDGYLRSYAASVRNYRHNVVIGFGQEMNASWYSWGYRNVPASTFVAAWRHIVTLFRDEGAKNVTWLWTIQVDGPGTGPIASWWPGASYVDWVGLDGFYYRPTDTFTSVFGKTINQVQTLTTRPILLSETAVGPDTGNVYAKILDLFQGLNKDGLLGLVWFDKDQDAGIYHQDWRLEDNETAQTSFSIGASDELATTLPTGQ
jgi:mannan endo-1,4-beta-mannosidase